MTLLVNAETEEKAKHEALLGMGGWRVKTVQKSTMPKLAKRSLDQISTLWEDLSARDQQIIDHLVLYLTKLPPKERGGLNSRLRKAGWQAAEDLVRLYPERYKK